MNKRLGVLMAVTAAALCILGPATTARAGSPGLQHRARSHSAPMIRIGPPLPGLGPLARAATQSSNWAGYDAVGGGYHSVSATWTQPAVAPDTSKASYSAFWVGLDGDGSSPVEQCGTDADNDHGAPSYYAWYEMYPAASVTISGMTITPGDVMHGSVVSDGAGNFTLTLSDETTGVTKTYQKSNASARGYSAEVIAEAPSDDSGVLPLADFGTVSFSECAFNGAPLAGAPYQQIDMVDESTNATLATTSALGADGASFSVTWGATPPPAPPTLSGLSPASGPVGTLVTLSGTGLTGALSVAFNGTPAQFTVDGDTKITATVPAGAASGAVNVTTPRGTAVSATPYTVIVVPPSPTLTSFSPASGPVGTLVTLSGTGFSGATKVTFDNMPASFLVPGATSITAAVPLTARSGPVRVTTPIGTATSHTIFTVTPLTAKLTLKLGGLSGTVLRLGKRVTMSARLVPTRLAGKRLTFTIERRHNGRWYHVLTRAQTTSSTGQANTTHKPGTRGTYRVRVTLAKTGANTAAASAWLRFVVK